MQIGKLIIAMAMSLALAACGSDSEGAKLTGEPVAKVAAPAGKQWTDVASKTEGGGYLIGNPDAKIKLTEFGSLTCHVCADFAKESGEDFHNNYINTGQVSLEFRNFVRDPIDLAAAKIIQCGANESFLPLTEQFMAFQPNLFENQEKLTPEQQASFQQAPENERLYRVAEALGIIEFFTQRGVSQEAAKTCLADKAAVDKLAAQTDQYAKDFQIQGTPTFLLNGQRVEGTAWTVIKGKLQEAGAR